MLLSAKSMRYLAIYCLRNNVFFRGMCTYRRFPVCDDFSTANFAAIGNKFGCFCRPVTVDTRKMTLAVEGRKSPVFSAKIQFITVGFVEGTGGDILQKSPYCGLIVKESAGSRFEHKM